MRERWIRAAGGCAIAALIAGCGGQGGEGDSNDPGSAVVDGTPGSGNDGVPVAARVRTGVFVDSPVAGLAYATPTRSGITDAEGRFEYRPGESVTFSIGALAFRAVAGGERLTPIDLGRGVPEVERFAINVARLLQSLDADGDAGNGIRIPAAAGGVAVPVDFDVESSAFERDPAVIALVASAGGPARELIAEAAAVEHFGVALGERSSPGATAGIAGFWESEAADASSPLDYAAISSDGELSVYRRGIDPDYGMTVDCFEVEHRTLTPLRGDDYLVADAPGGGNLGRMTFARPSAGRLEIALDGTERETGWSLGTTSVDDRTPADLALCTGQSSQVPPPEATGPNADIAGLWAVDDGGSDAPDGTVLPDEALDANELKEAFDVNESDESDGPDGPDGADGADGAGESNGASPSLDADAQDDRAVDFLRIDADGGGTFLVLERKLGPAPAFAPGECLAPIGALQVNGVDGDGTFRGEADFVEPVVAVPGEGLDGSADRVVRKLSLTREGATLALGLEGERERRLSIAGADIAALPPCGPDAVASPLDLVEGLWRERGAGFFGDHLRIDASGTLRGVAPVPGDVCYVDVPDATLTPIGGLDFLSVRDEGGAPRVLRMTRDGDDLTIAEVGSDGAVMPVRWLETVRGLSLDDFARCEPLAGPDAIVELEPLAGRWSRSLEEDASEDGAYEEGVHGEDVHGEDDHGEGFHEEGARAEVSRGEEIGGNDPHPEGDREGDVDREMGDTASTSRLHELVELSDAGRYRRVVVSSGGSAPFPESGSCRVVEHETLSGVTASDIDVVGDDLFRIGGELTALERENDTLTITGADGAATVFERSDIDIDALPSCETEPGTGGVPLAALDGLWSLEPPLDEDPGFTLLRLDTRERGDGAHFLYRFDAASDCHAVETLSVERASDGRLVLGRPYGAGDDVVGLFDLVDDELDIVLLSGEGALRGIRDGRYPRVQGLDSERLLHGYDAFRHDAACPSDGVR